jgi:hypothetical protein
MTWITVEVDVDLSEFNDTACLLAVTLKLEGKTLYD